MQKRIYCKFMFSMYCLLCIEYFRWLIAHVVCREEKETSLDREETSSLLSRFLDMGGGVNINFQLFSCFAFFAILSNFLLKESISTGLPCPDGTAIFLLPTQIVADISSYGLGIFIILKLSKFVRYLKDRGYIEIWLLEVGFLVAGVLLIFLHGYLYGTGILGEEGCKRMIH